jgi:hypothetical protein
MLFPERILMPLYICRWQNGDFSVVKARSKEHATILLDEVDNAELGELFPVKDFMVHFRLKKEVEDMEEFIPVELEEFGEDTVDMLAERVYPVYHKAIMDYDEDWPADDTEEVPKEKLDAGCKRLADALTTERNRNWGLKEPVLSDDEKAADLQRRGWRVPKAVAESVVRQHRRRKIFEMPPASKRPQ